MKLSDVANLEDIQHQLDRTQEFKRLLMDIARFAPGPFKLSNANRGDSVYRASWSKDDHVSIEVSKPFLMVNSKAGVEIEAWGHVRTGVPINLMNELMNYADEHKLNIKRRQMDGRDGKPWWHLSMIVPLEHYVEA